MSISQNVVLDVVLQGSAGGLLAGLGIAMFVFFLLFVVVPLAGLWKVFTKAGEPGWAALVPIYNIIVLLKVTNNPIWYIVGFVIPVVNFIVAVKVVNDLSTVFGKGIGYTLGMLFLPFVFIPMLGFGGAQYRGGGARGDAGTAQPM